LVAAIETTSTASPASATTFNVTNLNDDLSTGSFRAAVAAANASPGADTIVFDPWLSGTISMATSYIVISDAVTITGPGSGNVSIDAHGSFQILHASQFTGNLSISGLTFTGGYHPGYIVGNGGAISAANDGDVVLHDLVFDGNEATNGGAVFVGGQAQNVTISGSTFNRNSADTGGALQIQSTGNVTISSSTFTNNTAYSFSGALSIQPTGHTHVTLQNSTVDGNTAGDRYGGGSLDAYNVYVMNSTISNNQTLASMYAVSGMKLRADSFLGLSNSTISGNHGSGEALKLAGAFGIEVDQSTITNNTNTMGLGFSAGIRFPYSQPIMLSGSIVSGNNGGGPDIDTGGGAVFSADHSIIGICSPSSIYDIGGNQLGVTDPGLAALAYNGGPTKTHLPNPNSPALDAGPDPIAGFPGNQYDQRGVGYPRLSNGRSDVGAVEVQPAPAPPTTTTSLPETTTTAVFETSTTMEPDPVVPTFTG